MIKPPRLRPGQAVGIISPSWGGAGEFPHQVESGINHLKSIGFQVLIPDNALCHKGYVSASPKRRVDDIHMMFLDADVGAIVAAIGGDHSCQLLPHLDFDLIANHPKILVGFSDVTVLNVAIWSETGLITFNGPALLTDFAEYPRMFDYTEKHFLKTVCEAEPVGHIEPSTWWTEEFLDWRTKKDLTRPRVRRNSEGWTWLKPGVAEGPLVGGCLDSLQHLRGTRFWPSWDGAIMFIETSERPPDPATVDGILMDYENMGVMERIAGLLVGRPMRYSDHEKVELREIILERTQQYTFPIVTDLDFGHTSPQFTIPIGCRGRMDSTVKSFAIIEAAVE